MRELIVYRMKVERIAPRQMARCFRVSERTWYNWLSQPEKHLNLERLKVIADVLNMRVDEFLEVI